MARKVEKEYPSPRDSDFACSEAERMERMASQYRQSGFKALAAELRERAAKARAWLAR